LKRSNEKHTKRRSHWQGVGDALDPNPPKIPEIRLQGDKYGTVLFVAHVDADKKYTSWFDLQKYLGIAKKLDWKIVTDSLLRAKNKTREEVIEAANNLASALSPVAGQIVAMNRGSDDTLLDRMAKGNWQEKFADQIGAKPKCIAPTDTRELLLTFRIGGNAYNVDVVDSESTAFKREWLLVDRSYTNYNVPLIISSNEAHLMDMEQLTRKVIIRRGAQYLETEGRTIGLLAGSFCKYSGEAQSKQKPIGVIGAWGCRFMRRDFNIEPIFPRKHYPDLFEQSALEPQSVKVKVFEKEE